MYNNIAEHNAAVQYTSNTAEAMIRTGLAAVRSAGVRVGQRSAAVAVARACGSRKWSGTAAGRSLTASTAALAARSFHSSSAGGAHGCLLQQDRKTQPQEQQKEQEQHEKAPQRTPKVQSQQPLLMIAFTCKKCSTRSSHTMSKQAYTAGTVLIQCPGCKGRHLIADHLKIFHDDHVTVEQILAARGETVSQDSQDLVLEDVPESLRTAVAAAAANKNTSGGAAGVGHHHQH